MPVKRYKIRFTGCNYSSSTAFLPVSGLKNILFFKKLTAGIKKLCRRCAAQHSFPMLVQMAGVLLLGGRDVRSAGMG